MWCSASNPTHSYYTGALTLGQFDFTTNCSKRRNILKEMKKNLYPLLLCDYLDVMLYMGHLILGQLHFPTNSSKRSNEVQKDSLLEIYLWCCACNATYPYYRGVLPNGRIRFHINCCFKSKNEVKRKFYIFNILWRCVSNATYPYCTCVLASCCSVCPPSVMTNLIQRL